MNATCRSFLALAVTVALATACADDADRSADGSAPPSETTGSTRNGVDVGLEIADDGSDGDNDDSGDDGSDDGTVRGGGGGRFFRLAPFADCSTFLAHVKAEARDRVGPYGLDGSGYPWPMFEDMAVAAEATEAPAATDAPAGAMTDAAGTSSVRAQDGGDQDSSGGGVTGTNTQEAGVDEPDIIKSDGDRIITVSENVLSYVDLTGEQPVLTGQLTLPDGWGHQLFLNGDRALLLSNAGMWGEPMPIEPLTTQPVEDMMIGPYGQMPGATITEIDLSDPSAPAIAARLRIEGQYLNARAIGDRMLLAVTSGPQALPWLYPQNPSAEDRAREANQQLIEDSTLADWVPQFELDANGAVTTGDLIACDRLNRPAEFSGFDVISVLSVDLNAGLAGGFDTSDAVGVLAGGQTVYASLDRFYVATTKWMAVETFDQDQMRVWSESYETDLHAFSITPGARVEYLASGSVRGSLLNSFSLDEHNGYLRVLATDGSPWEQSNISETRLTVFEEQGDRLLAIGEVGGLGRGERLYSARLIGDRGFAVTFRQVDPFYVLDLTDPTNPQVTGELKIPGFSTYLHPVGEHRVLGIGQAATEEGRVTGLKLSLFDVSDPANPSEISTWTLDSAGSAAEYDHHAFQMIGSTAILPVQSYGDGFNGAIVFEIGDAISEIGRITHVEDTAPPTSDCRELVQGDLPESSPAYWLSVDTWTRTQLCTANQTGGYGHWQCDSVPVDELGNWFGFGTGVADELAALNGGELDRMEMCYPPDGYMEAIQRSIVVDGSLWTMSVGKLRAHELATLAPIAGVDLR